MTIETTLQSRLNDQQLARGGIRAKKTALLYWYGRFAAVFDAYFGASEWAEARPVAAQFSAAEEKFAVPMLDVDDLWKRFDELEGASVPPGLAVPIVLTGETAGVTLNQVQFAALITGLRADADGETIAAGRVKRARSRRNMKQRAAHETMKLYRLAMPPALPSGDELQATLPRLTPADTGAPPEPVNASAVYVSGATSQTVHDATTTADAKEYQLRGVIGEEWDEDDAVTIATHPLAAPREFAVEFGLTQPETSIVLKVFVVTLTGRERGSAPMRVDRPPA